MSDTLEVKAHRLARSDDAITVLRRHEDTVIATVRGDTNTYDVELYPGASTCTCVAHTVGHRVCSHIKALHLYESYGAIWAAERRARIRQLQRDWEET